MAENQNEDTPNQKKPEETGQADQPRNMTMEELREFYIKFTNLGPSDIAEVMKRRRNQ